MDRKKLLIAGGLIGFCLVFTIIIVSCGMVIFALLDDPFPEYNAENASFDNSTPELTAVSIARLNFGSAFNGVSVEDVYLTDDGKYWIVGINTHDAGGYLEVTVDVKTLMSKRSDGYGGWSSLDELKAIYIAEIQSPGPLGKPQKITIDGKEIWKIPVLFDSDYQFDVRGYIYVDLATGKSKNTVKEFKSAAGTSGWLTLEEVDHVIDNLGYYPNQIPFIDVLRDLYSE